MAIMRSGNTVSDKLVKDNYPRETENTGMAKADKADPKFAGIADKANYGGKSAQ